MIPEEYLKDFTLEPIEKVKKCRSNEELLRLAKEEGIDPTRPKCSS